MNALPKYALISASVLVFALGMVYAFQLPQMRENSPLSPEEFDRLVSIGAPTKEFDESGALSAASQNAVSGGFEGQLPGVESPAKGSSGEVAESHSIFRSLFEKRDRGGLAGTPAKNSPAVDVTSPFWVRLLERFDPFKNPFSPSKELADGYGPVKPLPVPVAKLTAPSPTVISASGIPQPQQIVQVIERIVEKVIIREVQTSAPPSASSGQAAPAPASAPKPTPAPSLAETPTIAPACSIQAFDNAVGSISHTLIFRCDDPNSCSIVKEGESFVDVIGKGYFNFPGASTSYKIRCGDKSTAWNSSISSVLTKPLISQVGFRWFANDDGEVPGRPLAEINKPLRSSLLPTGGYVRLRIALLASRAQVVRGEGKFKLQGAVGVPAVGAASLGLDTSALCNNLPDDQYRDLQTLDQVAFFNNPSVNDKVLMATKIEDPFYGVAIPQTYQETNSIVNLNATIPAETPALWDLSLRIKSIDAGGLICFRTVRSDGLQLEGYNVWPAAYDD